MKKLLVFLATLFAFSSAVYAQASSGGTGSGSNSTCTYGTSAMGFPYRTVDAACAGLIERLNVGQEKKWKFTRSAYSKGGSDATSDSYICYGTHPAFGNSETVAGTVNSTCKKPTENECKARPNITRIFDWIDERKDDYDIYDAPNYISFNSCEYKRNGTVSVAANPKMCKYPVSVTYSATGETRTTPVFSDVPENCNGDDDGGEEGEVTPGSFPAIRDLYEAKYPKGVAGVVTAFKAEIEQTQFKQLITKMTAQTGLPGVCPLWNISFDFGFVNLGDRVLAPDCELLKSLKWITIISALFLARRIIFGG